MPAFGLTRFADAPRPPGVPYDNEGFKTSLRISTQQALSEPLASVFTSRSPSERERSSQGSNDVIAHVGREGSRCSPRTTPSQSASERAGAAPGGPFLSNLVPSWPHASFEGCRHNRMAGAPSRLDRRTAWQVQQPAGQSSRTVMSQSALDRWVRDLVVTAYQRATWRADRDSSLSAHRLRARGSALTTAARRSIRSCGKFDETVRTAGLLLTPQRLWAISDASTREGTSMTLWLNAEMQCAAELVGIDRVHLA